MKGWRLACLVTLLGSLSLPALTARQFYGSEGRGPSHPLLGGVARRAGVGCPLPGLVEEPTPPLRGTPPRRVMHIVA